MEERRLERTEEVEDQEREDKLEELKTRLELARSIGGELWGVLKQPFGYLVAGIIAWVLYHNFAVPRQPVPSPSLPPTQASP
jgi:hypothetical protein